MSRAYSKPIGVFVIVLPSFSLSEVEVLRSFGAGQCASSEGFLATFTPVVGRIGEVIFSYSGSAGFIHIPSKERGTYVGLSRPVKVAAFGLFGRAMIAPAISDENVVILQSWMRSNVMTPAPNFRGIMEASIPSDEGRIGTGRNTQKYD
jgi:hypothetical protein